MLADDGTIRITPALSLPRRELSFRASTAGGPGGQHVNRSATRVELRWNVLESPSLTDHQRALLAGRFAGRMDRAGRIRLVSGERRSQLLNREAVEERFVRLLAAALQQPRPRKKTKPTRASVQRRIKTKKHRSDTKRLRGRVPEDE